MSIVGTVGSIAIGIGGTSSGSGAAPGVIPVIEGFTSASDINNVTTLSVPGVPGVVSGDLLVLFTIIDQGGTTDQFQPIAGWTKLGEENLAGVHTGCFYKVAAGGEGAVSFTWLQAVQPVGFQIRISGVNNAAPIDASGFSSTASALTTHTIPEITTVSEQCLALYCLGFDGGDGFPFSVASPWTEQDERRANDFAITTSACWGSQERATAGLTGDALVTCSVADRASYLQLSLRPA